MLEQRLKCGVYCCVEGPLCGGSLHLHAEKYCWLGGLKDRAMHEVSEYCGGASFCGVAVYDYWCCLLLGDVDVGD